MLFTLKNKKISVTVNSLGAQMMSLQSADGMEYLWQGEAEFWSDRAPNLVLNTGHLISDFPEQACVEVPCLVDGAGIHPTYVGALPPVLAAMNMSNINVQLLAIEAARTRKKEDIVRAALLEPHTAAELSPDDIEKMVAEMIEAHGDFMAMYQ